MEIRHNIVLDAAQPNVQCSLMMSTGDVSSHRVVIALRNGVEPVPLENVSGYVHFSKPDSTEVVQSAVVYWDNGTAAGVMTFIVNQQVLTATGRVTCRAVLCGAEGEELYSPVFVIDVASNAALDAPLTSQSEYAALTDAKLEAQAWAEGKKGTVDVIEGQQQYENNAKYYAACAQAAAEDIEGKLEECETWEDGKSAYELAVENGFEGTVVEWLASLVGETGPSGSAGAAGKGISSIAKTGTSGLVDTYTITYSDGTTSTFTVTNGAAGQNGTNGTDGQDGADGKSAYELAVENGFEGTEAEWLASLVGAAGQNGSAGAAGKGISSIAKTGTSGLIDTYTITYTDGTTSTFTVTNGAAGQNGTNGTNGTDGQDGADGKSAYELAVENGFEGTEAEWLASLVGAAGQNGTNGTNGTNGRGISSVAKTGTNGLVDTYTITFTDGTTSTFTVTNGAAGQNGSAGAAGKGISSIAKTGTSGLVDTYTITYTDGTTSTFTVTNGAAGQNGTNGTNGTSAYAAAVAAGYSGTEAQFNAALAGVSGKQDKATVITQSAPTAITLADNTEYYLTNVTSLALTYPSGNFECWLRITTASSGTITVTLPTSTYIGDAPTFDNGQTWELSIKDGVVVAGEVAA